MEKLVQIRYNPTVWKAKVCLGFFLSFISITIMKMIKKLFFFYCFLFIFSAPAGAVTVAPVSEGGLESTSSAEVTPSAIPTIEIKDKITEPGSEEVKGKLAAVLNEQTLGPLSFDNFLKHFVRYAVDRGVPANTIVLILLLPLIGALVGVLQYFVGLSGFSTFMPAMIAVTFLATGIAGGLILFGVILIATLVSGKLLRRIKLYYWPRRAITLMIVSLITFVLLALSPSLGLLDLTQISIFPILFLILLSEEFTRVQVGKSKKSAVSLTIGTLVISILGASLMSWEYLQKLVLLNPEISFLVVLILNIFIGRYGGWRLSEYQRFKSLLKRRTS